MFISEDVKYVGVNDTTIDLFEGQYKVPDGISYNSYVILDEKTAVMDTVDINFSAIWLEKVKTELGDRKPDYLVVQHMEPDHSASIAEFLKFYPDTTVVGNAKTFTMIKGFCPDLTITNTLTVKEGDTLTLGSHVLTFIFAPMVHWPEVMVTYDAKDKILFSADAFGTFGALAGNIFDDEITFDTTWMNDARRYYTNIVGKYGVQVQALLKKAASLDIEMICPLHGPIWRKDLGLLLEKYQKWSTYEPEDKTVMIAYATMYGNTENAANVLAGMLADKGVKNIAMYDVSETDVSELVAESFRCSHLVLAAPTYNSRIQPKMEAYLSDIKALNLQNRTVAVIDNGTWAATAGKQMIGTLEGMKNMTILENTISIKSALAENQLGALEALADELAKQVNG